MRALPPLIFLLVTGLITYGVMPGMTEATAIVTRGGPQVPPVRVAPITPYEPVPAPRPAADPVPAAPRTTAGQPRRPVAPAAPRMHPAERLLTAPPAGEKAAPPAAAPEVEVP